jgi:hypothetical protein
MTLGTLSLAGLIAVGVSALAACSKQVDGNANAPGSPGTGNATEVVRPAMPDSPSGRPPPAGTTGAGSTSSSSQNAQPGTGLGGGLGSNSAMGSSPAGTTTGAPVGSGSTNATTGSAVGQRP